MGQGKNIQYQLRGVYLIDYGAEFREQFRGALLYHESETIGLFSGWCAGLWS